MYIKHNQNRHGSEESNISAEISTLSFSKNHFVDFATNSVDPDQKPLGQNEAQSESALFAM